MKMSFLIFEIAIYGKKRRSKSEKHLQSKLLSIFIYFFILEQSANYAIDSKFQLKSE